MRRVCWALTFILCGSVGTFAEERVRFNRDIRPILSDKCFFCHGPDENHRQADLRLDTRGGVFDPRDGEAVIVPGKPDQSRLLERITSDDALSVMPPPDSGKELSARERDLLRRWIAQGAEYEEHWAYLPIGRPDPPTVQRKKWPVNAIDRFVLASVEARGLKPSVEADKATLLRRVYFDLIGLPPTPAEVDSFVSDSTPNAFEKVVDRLLSSPHYGERLAIYWLDLVRYADTVGYHGDQEHHATLYRDYVIKSFNDNIRFDQFTREQLAGDLLPDATTTQQIASGYNRILQTSHEGGVQQKEYLAKYAADRVRNFSEVWLAGTMGCAECHDHKYDPFSQADFYAMEAFFADVNDLDTFKASDTSPTRRAPEIDAISPIDEARIAEIVAELEQLNQERETERLTEEGRNEITLRIEELTEEKERRENDVRKQMVTVSVEPRPIHLLNRGDWMDTSGPVMQPAVPEFLPGLLPGVETETRATRLELANWLMRADNPLTARVFVNRLWYLYFGQGIVRSLADFGSQGEWPSHPELLDWLSREFIESGWDIKHLVRLIVTSRTYRQSSLVSKELQDADPSNRLFARQGRFRLSAEMIRDQALAVSGLLVESIGGSSARPYQPAGYYKHLNFPKRAYLSDNNENQYRRGVYIHWQRQFLHPMLRAFDAPTREECTAQRTISNTPSAALTLLNDPTFIEAARVLAVRGLEAEARSTRDRIGWLWKQVLSRDATQVEVDVLVSMLETNRTEYLSNPESAKDLCDVGMAPVPESMELVELASWTSVCRAILNLNEAITRN